MSSRRAWRQTVRDSTPTGRNIVIYGADCDERRGAGAAARLHRATRANRRPAAAGYHRAPGDTLFWAFNLDVLRIEDGLIAEVTTFNHDLFPAFGLAPVL